MRKLLSERFAAIGILLILSAIVVFHFLIIAGIIPFGIVWGGRLQSHAEMIKFETVSVLLNLVMIAIVSIKAGLLKLNLKPFILKVSFWFMTILFTLNTIGNLFSTNSLETLIFTPLTLILAIFSFRLALSKEQQINFSADQDKNL